MTTTIRALLAAAVFFFAANSSNAQRIFGTVFTENGDILPYASVILKGTTKGTSANDRGKYSLIAGAGKFRIECRHVGYTTVEKEITIDKDTELSFILPEQKLLLEAVVIKTNGEDPAYAMIRKAIKKRNFYRDEVNTFTAEIYGKDMIRLNNLPKRILGQKVPDEDRRSMGLDSTGKGIIYLSESVSKVSVQGRDKFKLEVMSSRVSGSSGFGFNFPAFISLYNNNVTVFTERLNPRGFVSPVADGAISFYKFKYLGSFYENGKEINSIRVTARRKYEPLFNGVINIEEGAWRIHSFDLSLSKTSQLEILDSLRITQQHAAVVNDVWRVRNQLLQFQFKQLGIDAGGNFLTVYSDYNLQPAFPKNFFNNVVIKYDTAVNKKSAAYWDSIRAVPLEKEEELDYRKKDSTFNANKDSLLSRRSIDSLNRNQKKIKITDPFIGGISRRRVSRDADYYFGLSPLIPTAAYNFAEGPVLNAKLYLNKRTRKTNRQVSFAPLFRYGFGNGHFNPSASLSFNKTPAENDAGLRRQTISFSGGKRVSDFNPAHPYGEFRNTISSLLFGRNYLKTYENYFGRAGFSRRYESGLQLRAFAQYEDRSPLDNVTDFTVFKKYKSRITPNFPTEKISTNIPEHQSAVVHLTLSYRPGGKFIQLPKSKIPLGSKYPTFTLAYWKGIKNILGSDADFDRWLFTISDDKNFKLAGTLKYKFFAGGFLNDRAVQLPDFQHFNGNRTLAAADYVNSFQLLPYFQYSTTASLYSAGHIEHHFNGLFTNKIPVFRKLNWNLVVGANALAVHREGEYAELFAGIENIFKIFRLDFVAGYNSRGGATSGIRIGGGGLLGGSLRVADNALNIDF